MNKFKFVFKLIKGHVFLLIITINIGYATSSDQASKFIVTASSPHSLSEYSINGTLVSAYDKANRLLFSVGLPLTWNSYCASVPGEIHAFIRPAVDKKPDFSTISRIEPSLHSAHVVNIDGNTYVLDRANNRKYSIKPATQTNQKYQLEQSAIQSSCHNFTHNQYAYTHDSGNNIVSACRMENPAQCDKITINEGTWPYVYAGNQDNDVVVTNWGDVLFHSEHGWCRGKKVNDGFKCAENEGLLKTYRGLQMYSSIVTDQGTLLGEWPTGRLWRLGNGTLTPTKLGPYTGNTYNNLELQSMSLFCGDLYVGFWPFGEIWRKSADDKQWANVYRLFSEPKNNHLGDIPYYNILSAKSSNAYSSYAFLGQRASSMANAGQSLFISSSNLVGWNELLPDPDFLTKQQINEYGNIHYVINKNCTTVFAKNNINLQLELTPKQLVIYNNGILLSSISLDNFNLNAIDKVIIGDGVFGKLSDKDMFVRYGWLSD